MVYTIKFSKSVNYFVFEKIFIWIIYLSNLLLHKVLTDVTVADLLDLAGIATAGRFKAESPNMKSSWLFIDKCWDSRLSLNARSSSAYSFLLSLFSLMYSSLLFDNISANILGSSLTSSNSVNYFIHLEIDFITIKVKIDFVRKHTLIRRMWRWSRCFGQGNPNRFRHVIIKLIASIFETEIIHFLNFLGFNFKLRMLIYRFFMRLSAYLPQDGRWR